MFNTNWHLQRAVVPALARPVVTNVMTKMQTTLTMTKMSNFAVEKIPTQRRGKPRNPQAYSNALPQSTTTICINSNISKNNNSKNNNKLRLRE